MTIGTRDQFKRALRKAQGLRGWEQVHDLGIGSGIFTVQGTGGDKHMVTVDVDGEYACTCKAGARGLPCWHQAAVWLVGVQRAAFRPMLAGMGG